MSGTVEITYWDQRRVWDKAAVALRAIADCEDTSDAEIDAFNDLTEEVERTVGICLDDHEAFQEMIAGATLEEIIWHMLTLVNIGGMGNVEVWRPIRWVWDMMEDEDQLPGFTDETLWNGFLNVWVDLATMDYLVARLAREDGEANTRENLSPARIVLVGDRPHVSLAYGFTTVEVERIYAHG